MDVRLTIDPPASGTSGTTPRTKFVTLRKFSRTRASCPLVFTSRKAAWNPPPALLTRMSTRSNCSPTTPRKPLTWSLSRTSTSAATTRRPDPSIASAVPSRFGTSRSQIARSAPKLANVSAMASPMPTAAPVTTATRSVSSAADGSRGTAWHPTAPLCCLARATHSQTRRYWSPARPPGSAPRLPRASPNAARSSASARGGIDVLVNNAGIPKRRRVTELSPDVVDAVMAINYLSPIRLTLALLPELIDRSGRIVNISSVAARLGPGTEAAYAASKAALTAWSEAMAIDLADTGVKVHVVNPGIIDTELFRLPDNEEPIADMSMALPVEAIVQPVVDQLDSGTFEIYVPEWFQDVVAGKIADPDGFQQGTIEYLRSRGALG